MQPPFYTTVGGVNIPIYQAAAQKPVYDGTCGGPTPCTCDDMSTPHCTDGSVPTVVSGECICDDGTEPLCADGNPPTGVPLHWGGSQCAYCIDGTGRAIVKVQLPANWTDIGGDPGCSYCQTVLSNRIIHVYNGGRADICAWGHDLETTLMCDGSDLGTPWQFRLTMTDDGTNIIIQFEMSEDFVGFQSNFWQLNTGIPIATKINCNWVNLAIPWYGIVGAGSFSPVCTPAPPEGSVLLTAI